MTKRSELRHRKAEAQAKLMANAANKAFSKKETGLDRLAKTMVAKTAPEHFESVHRALDEHHPYDVPECVALRPVAVEARYLAWLHGETREAPPSA